MGQLIDSVSKNTFHDRLGDDFSYHAKDALFDYYEMLADDLGENIEFDPVAIRCEWSEYETAQEALQDYLNAGDYDDFISDCEDDDDIEADALNYFEARTRVIEFKEGVLLSEF